LLLADVVVYQVPIAIMMAMVMHERQATDTV